MSWSWAHQLDLGFPTRAYLSYRLLVLSRLSSAYKNKKQKNRDSTPHARTTSPPPRREFTGLPFFLFFLILFYFCYRIEIETRIPLLCLGFPLPNPDPDKDRRLSRPPLFFFTRLLTHEGGARGVQVRKQAHSIYFSSSLLPAFLRYAPIVVHHASY